MKITKSNFGFNFDSTGSFTPTENTDGCRLSRFIPHCLVVKDLTAVVSILTQLDVQKFKYRCRARQLDSVHEPEIGGGSGVSRAGQGDR